MEESIHLLIVRYLSNEATPGERNRLQTWLREDPAHRQQFEEYRQLWQLTDHAGAVDPQTEMQWQVFRQETLAGRVTPAKQSSGPFGLFRRPAMQLAAALALLIAVTAVLLHVGDTKRFTELTRVETQAQQQRKITLPDGSVVWLNRGSTLRYPEFFGTGNREVRLSGEAFFEVARDTVRPFIIYAQEAITRVLGTSFNLRAYPDDSLVQVAVVSGKVRFTAKNQTDPGVLLTAGFTGTMDKASGYTLGAPNRDINFLSWKTGSLVFENTPLGEVAAALARHYRTPVLVQGPALSSRRITTRFRGQPLEEVLKEIALLLDISYHRNGSQVVLTGPSR